MFGKNEIIVTCNGCFDGLHAGHMFLLGCAYALGDRLVVGINDDTYIITHKRKEPNFLAGQRVRLLLNTGIVDRVRIFKENDASEFIKRIKPDIHCIGEEYIDNFKEKDIIEELGIKLFVVPRIKGFSTTTMITHVAIIKDGKVYSLPKPHRHCDIIKMMINEYELTPPCSGKQGFLTNKGVFVDRKEAAKIALESGQIKELQYVKDKLFSEDLW